MRRTRHFDLSDQPLLISQCSGRECVEKYTLIQDAIDHGLLYEAVEKAISLFELDTSGLRSFEIVDELPARKTAEEPSNSNPTPTSEPYIRVAHTSASLKIKLSHHSFSSAPYLVIILVHELGHVQNYNKYYTLIKRLSGISPSVSNTELINIFEGVSDAEKLKQLKQHHLKPTPHVWIFPLSDERLVYNGEEITATQVGLFLNYISLYLSLDGPLYDKIEEADACLFTLKHRHRLYLALDSYPIQSQLAYLKDSLHHAIAEDSSLQLTIEAALTQAARDSLLTISKDEQEQFKEVLLLEMKREVEEISTYLKNFNF
ncbi:MAG: hypothetical protein HYY62_07775 [Deltaproteobacteria bacterium]|nr:hypothetical protein [Deltaproteobacteria bacterium]